MKKIKAFVIIPCKLDSSRFPFKNIAMYKGKPLIQHTIEYAMQCPYVKDIYISTEDANEISRLLPESILDSVFFLDRPANLLKDAEVTDVYIHHAKELMGTGEIYGFDYFVGLQPDNLRDLHFPVSLETIINYADHKKYNDLVTTGADGVRSGSVRVIDVNDLVSEKVSKRIGVFQDMSVDIHHEEELKEYN